MVLVSRLDVPLRGLRIVLGRSNVREFQPKTELRVRVAALGLGGISFRSGCSKAVEEESKERFIHAQDISLSAPKHKHRFTPGLLGVLTGTALNYYIRNCCFFAQIFPTR